MGSVAVLIFAISLCGFYKLALGGEIFLVDLFSIGLFACLAFSRRSILFQPVVPIGLTVIAYQLVLDVVLETPLDLMARGLAVNATMVCHFATLAYAAHRWPRWTLVAIFGLGLSLVIMTYLFPAEGTAEFNPWKFGVSQGAFLGWSAAATFLVSRHIVSSRWYYPTFVVGSAALFTLLSFAHDSRGAAFIFLAASAFAMLFAKARRPSREILILVTLCVTAAVPFLFKLYSEAALDGSLGDDARNRARVIAKASGGNGLLESRHEVVDTASRVTEALPFGLGSFPAHFSVHSHLIGAMVETGFIGGLLWLYALFYIVKCTLKDANRLPGAFYGIYISLAIFLTSSVLFAPALGYQRVLTSVTFAAFQAFVSIARNQTELAEQMLGRKRRARTLRTDSVRRVRFSRGFSPDTRP